MYTYTQDKFLKNLNIFTENKLFCKQTHMYILIDNTQDILIQYWEKYLQKVTQACTMYIWQESK